MTTDEEASNLSEPIAYYNGRWIPFSQATIPVYDLGFVLGVSIGEQLRTFGGEIFHLKGHLDRLEHSLAVVGVEHPNRDELTAAGEEIVRRNRALLAAEDDLGLAMIVTPGPSPAFAPAGAQPRPTVCLHTYPLPFGQWAEKYRTGQRLVVTDVRQVPAECWPSDLKCRSRMHYHLADLEARRKDPAARALLLDLDGVVTEASTANVLLWRRDSGFVAPRRAAVLPGVSIAYIRELAEGLGETWTESDLSPQDVAEADEVMLTSTPFALLPVSHLDGAAVGDGSPGPTYRRLLAAWGKSVGVAIDEQAARFADRPLGATNA